VKKKRAPIIIGLSASLFLSIVAALVCGACVDNADNCYNTATCPPPGYCIEAGDARDEVDGCF
jgi:hypothetical protein